MPWLAFRSPLRAPGCPFDIVRPWALLKGPGVSVRLDRVTGELHFHV
jgi:hypothetical protein